MTWFRDARPNDLGPGDLELLAYLVQSGVLCVLHDTAYVTEAVLDRTDRERVGFRQSPPPFAVGVPE